MRFFITGAAGFIGFHLSQRLLNEGHSVHGYDGMTEYYDVELKKSRLSDLEKFAQFTHTVGMLENMDCLANAAIQSQCDIIVHLAAQAGVRYSLENPRAYIDSNLVGSFNVLEVAKMLKPRHLLIASSSSVYGANDKVPFEESDKTDEPLTIYAATKKSMEVMAHAYAHLWKIPTTAFRFFTVYGPYGRPDMALFKFATAAQEGKPIDIYGSGKLERDFTYIDDLVEAIVRLLPVVPSEDSRLNTIGSIDTLSAQAPFRIVNIGGGNPVGLMCFVETIEEALGMPIQKNYMDMQMGDVPRTYASPNLLGALTDFKPKVDVREGVKNFISWFRSYYKI